MCGRVKRARGSGVEGQGGVDLQARVDVRAEIVVPDPLTVEDGLASPAQHVSNRRPLRAVLQRILSAQQLGSAAPHEARVKYQSGVAFGINRTRTPSQRKRGDEVAKTAALGAKAVVPKDLS